MAESCQDCIWWYGVADGYQGYCNEHTGAYTLLIGRHESCVNVLLRELPDIFSSGR